LVALGFVAGAVLANVTVAVTAMVVPHPRESLNALSNTWWGVAAGLVGIWGGMLAAVALSATRGQMPWRRATWRVRPLDVLFVALGVAVQLSIDAAYTPLHIAHLDAPLHRLFGATTSWTFYAIALLTVVGAPVVEEMFFRATLFRALDLSWDHRGRLGQWAAVVVSALLFATAHFEWVQLPGLLVIGVVLALVYRRTQRLLPSVLTHAGFNLVPVVVLLWRRGGA